MVTDRQIADAWREAARLATQSASLWHDRTRRAEQQLDSMKMARGSAMTEFTYSQEGPPLIHGEGYAGYFLDDIKEFLESVDGLAVRGPFSWSIFKDWLHGQTGAIHEGRLLVYEHDWQRYLDGGKVYD